MNVSKNLYNYLNTCEMKFFFKNEYFFVVEDSLMCNNRKKLQNFSKRQFIKINFKIHLTSNIFMFKKIKFPVYIIFFKKLNFFEEYFLNFYVTKTLIIFLKFKSKILNVLNFKYSLFLDYKQQLLKLDFNNNFNLNLVLLKI